MATKTVAHLPKPGHSSGLSGQAYCGRWARYATGDHEQIRRAALADPDGFCQRCLREMRRSA